MSVDVDAVLRIGWTVPYDEAVNYMDLFEEDFAALESIPGVECGSEWVDSTSEYSDKPDIAVGWKPELFRFYSEDGRYTRYQLTTREFASQFPDAAKDEAARKAYEAVTGHAPADDPSPQLYARWW